MAHIHEVIDSDKCFTIDPITRAIVNDAGNKKTQLIQNDHNSERFAFQLPRYIEGHDMSLSNKVEVHYINLDQTSNERSVGVYEVNDLALSEDNESVLLSWLISNNATKYVGVLSFAICFKCMSDDVIDYSWNTAINSSIQIAKGMYNSEIIIKDYIDVLEVWKEEFMSSIGLSGGCLRTIDPIGTGSFSMNRVEGTDVGINSVTLGTGCIASGQGCYAEGIYTIAGNYERLNVRTATSVQIDSKNMMCLSISFNKEVFPISVGDSIIIMIGIVIDVTSPNIDVKFITSVVQSITEPDPSTEIKEYKIYIDENEILNSGTNFETTQVSMILCKNKNQSSDGSGPMSNAGCHAEGSGTTASGNSSHAEGYSTTASGPVSHAEGYYTTASGNSSHAEGYYTTASGDSSHAEGDNTTASGSHSHAEGEETTARASNSHAEGECSDATGDSSHAEGGYTTASGRYSHAEGYYTTASGNCSHAEGKYVEATGDYSHAEGYYTDATATGAHAEGDTTKASGYASHAEGDHTEAKGKGSHAEGYYTYAGEYSHAEGRDTSAASMYQHVQGKYNVEDFNGTYAHIVGGGTSNTDRKNIYTLDWNGNAVYSGDVSSKTLSINRKEGSTIGQNSVALGQDCTASGSISHAEGHNTTASGYASHAEGYYNLSGGYTKFDAALGSETVDSTINYYIDVANLDTTLISTNDEIYVLVEDNASTEKQICKIIVSSITEYNTTDEVSTVKHKIYFDENELRNQMSGFPNIKIINIHVKNNNNPYSTHAEGKYTTASGDSSHAEGYLTEASGDYGSHAEGVYTTASGDYGSHAEGEYATASGPVSHAEGYYTTASGDSSHAEGDNTTASGENSHAEGFKTTASGYASHAEGEYTKASSKYAHVEGYHTTARTNSQHVQGKYNVEDTNGTYAHIVGGGTSNTDRKNIHTLDWNGNAVYSGDVKATDSDGNQVSLLDTKWKLQGNVTSNNTIALPNNFTELKVMTFKTNDDYPIAYTQTIAKDMIDVINKNTVHLYCGNTQQYGASWSINTSAKTIQLANIENTTPVDNYATYLYYR